MCSQGFIPLPGRQLQSLRVYSLSSSKVATCNILSDAIAILFASKSAHTYVHSETLEWRILRIFHFNNYKANHRGTL